MERYTPDTMSRRDMTKCYSRYSLCILLSIALSQGLCMLLLIAGYRYFPELLNGEQAVFWSLLINDVSVYLPGLILIPLLLRRLPHGEKIPVNRLSLWELLQGVVFSLGAGYFFSMLTSLLIAWLEKMVGLTSGNAVEAMESALPPALNVLALVIAAPIIEELTYRKLLLERLRGLGDRSAVLLSALAFALFHANLYQTAYAFVLGAVFACVVLLTGSVRDAILLHMCVNGLSVFLTCFGSDPRVEAAMSICVYVFIVLSAVMLFCSRGKYQLEDGPLPFRRSEKLRACFRSVWFWLLLVGGLLFSGVSIFL